MKQHRWHAHLRHFVHENDKPRHLRKTKRSKRTKIRSDNIPAPVIKIEPSKVAPNQIYYLNFDEMKSDRDRRLREHIDSLKDR